MNSLMEKFVWPSTDWTFKDVGKRTIRIKGVAIRGDAVSRNQRQYLAKELKKSTNTWLENGGRPITINHNDNVRAGHITWMDYDEARNELLYEAEITREPYVSMIRNKSSEIRGVSIQAKYMFNFCKECSRKFYDEKEFQEHMREEHFKQISAVPHGIVGEAISLVLSPEEPGYDDTSITLAEMAKREISRLSETVTKEYKEKEQYELSKTVKAPVSVEAPRTIAVGPKLIEQEDEPEKPEDVEEQEAPEPPCPAGWHEIDGKCVKDEEATEQEEDEPEKDKLEEQEEVPTELPKQEDESPPQCPEGEHFDEDLMICVPDRVEGEASTGTTQTAETDGEGVDKVEEPLPSMEPATEPSCPTGQSYDKTLGICVPDKVEVEPPPLEIDAISATESLRLGEPFAGYTDFADCVAKNPDKEDPEAYCAGIQQKAEGEQAAEIKETANVYEFNKQLKEAVEHDRVKSRVRDLKTAEVVNKHSAAVKTLAENQKKLHKTISEALKAIPRDNLTHKEAVAVVKKIRGQIDETVKALRKLHGETVKSLKETSASVKQANERLNVYAKQDAKRIKEMKKQIDAAVDSKKVAELEKQVKEYKQEIDGFRQKADEAAAERNRKLEESYTKIDELEQKLEETVGEKQKLEETFGARLDNIEHGLKGDFKGKHQKVEETSSEGDPVQSDPMKGGK